MGALKELIRPGTESCRYYRHRGAGAMVYYPQDPPAKRLGLFLFNSGHKYRTGPHDLYVKMARELCADGLFVITLDSPELGDGFRDFADRTIAGHQKRIVRGAYVSAALSALRYYRETLELDAVIVSGLCGGTVTGIVAAARSRLVEGVVAWGCPFQIPGMPILGLEESAASEGEAQQTTRPVARPGSRLKRLLVGKIDWSHHWARAVKRLYALRGRNPSFNYRLAGHLEILFGRRLPVIFVFSEHDPHYARFKTFYRPWLEAKRADFDLDGVTRVIRGTNHVVAGRASVEELNEIFRQFCREFLKS